MSNVQEILLDNCNRTTEKKRIHDFYSGYLSMAIIMSILSPVTVILNAVTIYVFWRGKRLRSITDILLCFLTITDVIGGLLAMPFFAAESVLHAVDTESPCSIFLIRDFLVFFSVGITLVTDILIVLDRYFSIFYPYRYDVRKNQISFATSLVVTSWCVCFVICLISIITRGYSPAVYFAIVANACFVFLSVSIHLKVFAQARRTQRKIEIDSCHFKRNSRKAESWYRTKGARVTAVILFGIFFCYVPQIITGKLLKTLHYSKTSLIAFYWSTALILFNSIVNPLVYIWQMKWFRNALWKITADKELSVANSAAANE